MKIKGKEGEKIARNILERDHYRAALTFRNSVPERGMESYTAVTVLVKGSFFFFLSFLKSIERKCFFHRCITRLHERPTFFAARDTRTPNTKTVAVRFTLSRLFFATYPLRLIPCFFLYPFIWLRFSTLSR